MDSGTLRRLPLRMLIASSALLAGCVDSDEKLVAPEIPANGGELFSRYVALGTSITAGVQSAGINDSTQRASYANLLARQAGADFVLPLFNKPGCPPPLVAPLGQAALSPTGQSGRLGGASAPPCALRATPSFTERVQNLAVSGTRLPDAFNVLGNPDPGGDFNRQQTFILGGRNQIETMLDLQPTFLTVELGANDVLGPATSGVLGAGRFGADSTLTPLATIRRYADSLEVALRTSGARGVVVLGVVNTNFIGILQPGAFYFLSRDASGRFLGKPVNDNCSPVTVTGQPNPLSQALVSLEILGATAIPEINCADIFTGSFTYVLTPAEQQKITERTNEINALLKAMADRNGWSYLDSSALLARYLSETDSLGRYQRYRKCQELAGALQTGNPALIQSALVRSCPVPPTGATAAFAAPNFFGSLVSFDGVHPSSEAHRLLANELIKQINAKHQLSIPLLS